MGIERDVNAAWLRTLAHFLSHERRFTGDSTLPNGESTVEGLRRIAEHHAGAVEDAKLLRTLLTDEQRRVYASLQRDTPGVQ